MSLHEDPADSHPARAGSHIMSDDFFRDPVLNSPYEIPTHHWELGEDRQPTTKCLEGRRLVSFVTPIPKAKTSACFWQDLQTRYDIARAEQSVDTGAIETLVRPAS